jgi:glutathione peroxidase-family protein
VGAEGNADIAWNFAKFLIDKHGEVIDRIGHALRRKKSIRSLPSCCK